MMLRIGLITVFYFGLILDMHFANGGWKQTLDLGNLGIMLISWAFLLFLFFAVEATLSMRWARRVNAGLTFFYFLLNYFHRNTGQSFDFAILANNWHATTNVDSLSQTLKLAHDVFIAANVFWALVIAGLMFASYTWAPVPKLIRQRRVALRAIFALTLVGVTQLSYSHDQYSRLGRSVWQFYFPVRSELDEIAEGLPLLPQVEVRSQFSSQFSEKNMPNVFLVMVESLNARFIHTKHPDGRSYTPYFESLIAQGIFATNYYSPSVQTAKGHFAALCGQVSSTNSIEFRKYACSDIECLPSVVKRLGYQTYFFQAHGDSTFDNERNFLLEHGIEVAPIIAAPCAQETEPCTGWGIEDSYFYRRGFKYLADQAPTDKPVFVTMATIASHQPFMELPVEKRPFFPEQASRREGYLNHMKIVDDGFATLMEELAKSRFAKNSIVIITGDHGFPLGEHGNSHNENYAYNENFQVPLLILDLREKSRKGQRLDQPLSHLNLPATVLDMIGYSGPTPFVAQSIFAIAGRVENGVPVYLVQPYSGGYVGAVLGKYKYIFESQRQKEEVFDLQADPGELVDIHKTIAPETLASLQRAAAQIKRQQEVLSCE